MVKSSSLYTAVRTTSCIVIWRFSQTSV